MFCRAPHLRSVSQTCPGQVSIQVEWTPRLTLTSFRLGLPRPCAPSSWLCAHGGGRRSIRRKSRTTRTTVTRPRMPSTCVVLASRVKRQPYAHIFPSRLNLQPSRCDATNVQFQGIALDRWWSLLLLELVYWIPLLPLAFLLTGGRSGFRNRRRTRKGHSKEW